MADHVQKQVRGDPVQPPLERARLVALERTEHAHERFLRQILGVMRIARQAERQAVDAVTVLLDQLGPRRHVARTRVEGGGAGEILGHRGIDRVTGRFTTRIAHVGASVGACLGGAFVVHVGYLALSAWGWIDHILIVACEYSPDSATNAPGCT